MKLWIICRETKKYDTEEFSKLNNVLVIDPKRISIENINAHKKILIDNEEVSYPDKCLFWLGCATNEFIELLNYVLVEEGVQIINPLKEIMLFSNKFLTALELSSKNIRCIDMIKLYIDDILDNTDILDEKLGFPLILKSDFGSFGQGIYLVQNKHDLRNVIENIMLLDKNFNFHLEKYIDYDEDIRMYIIYGEYFLFKRVNKHSFKANFHQGSEFFKHPKNSEFDKIYKSIRENYKSNILAIDILIKDNQYYICEINSAPGFINFDRLMKNDFKEIIMEKINEK